MFNRSKLILPEIFRSQPEIMGNLVEQVFTLDRDIFGKRLFQYAVFPSRIMQMDIFYIINWILGSVFDTSDLRRFEYYRL